MKIQYASDLHLELKPEVPFHEIIHLLPDTQVLVLAGDIGNPQCESYCRFLNWCTNRIPHVLFIAGNHEYYHNDITTVEQYIRDMVTIINSISVYGKLYFLQRDTVQIEHVIFIGCTLWTPVSAESSDAVATGIADHSIIQYFDIETRNLVFNEHVTFLRNALIDKSPVYKYVVITHHTLITLMDRPPNSISCSFYNQLDDIAELADYSISGHIHNSWDFVYRGCHFLMNCSGHHSHSSKYINNAHFIIPRA